MTAVLKSLQPLLVVSPHYDDAVLSCGNLLAAVPGSTVITVFAGCPADGSILTDWDERCGFASAHAAMGERKKENVHALSVLGASAIDLDFLDSQYSQRPQLGSDLLGDTLAAMITQTQPAAVFFPLGLFHEDHVTVSDVLMTLCHRLPSVQWFVYADIPYAKRPERVARRLGACIDRGVAATPLHIDGLPERKATAIKAYRSQLIGLGDGDNIAPILAQHERYWRVHCNMAIL
jgi:LmbE family N-acetylglucosaminyl deacetylase